MTHSRPAARSQKPAKKRKPKALKSSATMSRTTIDPAAPWPFPSAPVGPKPAPKPEPKGLRYVDAQGVVRVYSFRERHHA